MDNLKEELNFKQKKEKEEEQNRIFLNNMLKRMTEKKYI